MTLALVFTALAAGYIIGRHRGRIQGYEAAALLLLGVGWRR